MKTSGYLVALVLVVSACALQRVNAACSIEEASRAELEVSEIYSWDEIFEAYQEFKHCDDGSVGEGFSDRIGFLLASSYQEFLDKYGDGKHPQFLKFVLMHTDSTLEEHTLRKIIQNASSCSKIHQSLCRRVSDKAFASLKDL